MSRLEKDKLHLFWPNIALHNARERDLIYSSSSDKNACWGLDENCIITAKMTFCSTRPIPRRAFAYYGKGRESMWADQANPAAPVSKNVVVGAAEVIFSESFKLYQLKQS